MTSKQIKSLFEEFPTNTSSGPDVFTGEQKGDV